MTIENGYYVADCTSKHAPVSRKDTNTFYLPVNVQKTEDGYEYEEYRFNLPVNYQIPMEIIEYMAHELDEYRKVLQGADLLTE